MSRRVRITAKAEGDLESAAVWWAEHRSAEQADRWSLGVRVAIRSLAETAEQCGPARESRRLNLPLRQMPYGLGHRPSHRVLFLIEGHEVIVLRVRHIARRDVTPDDLPR